MEHCERHNVRKYQPVILAQVGVHFPRQIPEGVAKGLKPRLFPLSVIPAKAGADCEMGPRLREDDGRQGGGGFGDTRPRKWWLVFSTILTPSVLCDSLMSTVSGAVR